MTQSWKKIIFNLGKIAAAIVIMLILFSPQSTSAQLADSPWPMYQGGPKHGGQSSIDTSHVDGTVKWTFQTGEGIESSPVIGKDGTIYVGSHDNKLYAINPNGTLKWSFYVGKPLYDDKFDVYKGILSTPAVAKDGTIYFSSLSDIFFAINPDGTEKWRHDLPITSDTWTSPVIGKDGTIYTGAARRKFEGSQESEYYEDPIGGVYAFNPNGTLKWHFKVEGDMAGSIAIGSNGTIYALTPEEDDKEKADGYLKAFTPKGKEIWKYHIEFSESSPTVAPDGTIYIGAGHDNRGFIALNPNGKEKWFFKTPNDISLIPGLAKDGTIYVGEWDGMFYAFNPDGSIKWKVKTPKGVEALISSPAIGAEGTIYFGAKDGLHAYYPDGTEKWHYEEKISGVVSSPAIGSDGTIYVGSWNGKLYAFGGSPPVVDEDEGPKDVKDKKETTGDVSITRVIGILGVLLIALGISIFSVLRKRKLKK